MSPEDTGPPFDTPASLPGEPAPTVTASSLTRTVKATMPSKVKKYDTSQAVEELYRKHAASLKQGDEWLY
jgi:hypothetical protein